MDTAIALRPYSFDDSDYSGRSRGCITTTWKVLEFSSTGYFWRDHQHNHRRHNWPRTHLLCSHNDFGNKHCSRKKPIACLHRSFLDDIFGRASSKRKYIWHYPPLYWTLSYSLQRHFESSDKHCKYHSPLDRHNHATERDYP